MRRFSLLAGMIVVCLAAAMQAAMAAGTSRCELADVGSVDTPQGLLLDYTNDAMWWQSEKKGCAFYGRGLILQLLGRSDDAIADYTRAIGWMGTLGEIYAARGDAYEARGEHEKAETDYAEAAQLSRSDANVLNSSCWERAKRGYPLDRALRDCDSAIELKPDLWGAWDSRCFVNYRLGNYAAAISDCDKSMAIWQDVRFRSRSQYVRGLAKIKNGDIQGGNSDIAAAKDVSPGVAKEYAGFGVTK